MQIQKHNRYDILLKALIATGIAFNLLLVLFLASSLSSSDISISAPNVPNDTYLSPLSIEDWFHTDALTQYHFFMGIDKGNKLKDWKISTVNHYFPVIPLYGIFYYTFKNPGLSLIMFIMAQLTIILCLLVCIAKIVVPQKWKEASTIGVLLVGLFTANALYSSDYNTSVNLLMPYHSGMFINVLLSLIFLYRQLKAGSALNIVLLSVSVVLATISNPLYHVYFTFPATFVLLILSAGNMFRYKYAILSIVLSCGIGYLLMRILPDMAFALNFNPARYDSFLMLKKTIVLLIESSLIMKAIISLFVLSYIYSFIISVKHIYAMIAGSSVSLDIYHHYHIYMSVVVPASLIAPVYAGNFLEPACARYILYSLLLGVFNTAIIGAYHTAYRKGNAFRAVAIGLSSVALGYVLVRGSAQNPFGAFRRLAHYNNTLASAVDSLSLKYPIKNGVSNFWDSKPITVFSKQKKTVAYTFSSLHLFHHSCCLTDFKYDSIGKPAYFNFIVLNQWDDTTSVCQRFGDSLIRVSEGGHRFYLVPEFTYNDNYDLVCTGRFDFEHLRQKSADSTINPNHNTK